MKKFYFAALLSLAALGTTGQNKLGFAAREVMEAYQSTLNPSPASAARQALIDNSPSMALYRSLGLDRRQAPTIGALITLDSEAAVGQFTALGYEIYDVVDEIVHAEIPLADVEALAAKDFVRHIAFGDIATPMMNEARPATKVDIIQNGTDPSLGRAYTGKGVVTSLFDEGLDPNHVNFLGADGSSRVKGVWCNNRVYESPALIRNFSTDNGAESHGTHVLGIMSGSYNGLSTLPDNPTGDNPFYGVATESDIIVGCGTLSNNNILNGVKYAVDYAAESGQPLVVNLSLGSTVGAHDGYSSFSRLLADYGKNAIICVAAGNDGDIDMGISKKLTADNASVKTAIGAYSVGQNSTGMLSSYNGLTGTADFYSSSNTPFTFKVVIVNAFGKTVAERVIDASTGGKKINIGGTGYPTYEQLSNFSSAAGANSYVQVSSNVGTLNNRYSVTVQYKLDIKATGNYTLGFVVEGKPGDMINAYVNGKRETETATIYSVFTDDGISGWDNGSPDGSISDMACGENIIVVGSYNTKKNWTSLSGGSYYYPGPGFDVGEISGYSSYGTLHDGSTLPDFCAPGCAISSSYSTFYVNTYGGPAGNLSSLLTASAKTSRDNYWGIMQGTSMATPLAAGVIALWLEADPTLTVAEAREIAMSTAVKDEAVTKGNPAQWGAGKLDALAGIKEVVRRASSGIASVELDDKAVIVTPLGGQAYNVFVGGAAHVAVTLYSLSGQAVASASAQSDELTIDASALQAGVYVMAVDTPAGRSTRKLAIR